MLSVLQSPHFLIFIIDVHSVDGCYKDVGFLMYDDEAPITPALTARGDLVKRNRGR